MAEKQNVPEIKVTDDYSIFKKLEGNRAVQTIRENKVRSSVRQIGQMPVPILCNEKMEIIDGQARFEVYKELGLPIYYMVVEGIGLQECVTMNATGTNWKVGDYIESYASLGNESYIRLRRLLQNYPELTMTSVICAATGRASMPNETIKNGLVEITEDGYNEAQKTLDYVKSFVPYMELVKSGNKRMLANALIFAYQCEDVDNMKMQEAFARHYMRIGGFGTMVEALECLSDVYNNRRKVGRVYLETEYKKVMTDSYSWYAKKWGL